MSILTSGSQAWLWNRNQHIPITEFEIESIEDIGCMIVAIRIVNRPKLLRVSLLDAPRPVFDDIMRALTAKQSAVADGCTPYLLVSEENAKGREQSEAASAPRA